MAIYIPSKTTSTSSQAAPAVKSTNEFENMSTTALLKVIDDCAAANIIARKAQDYAASEQIIARRNAALRVAATRNDYC